MRQFVAERMPDDNGVILVRGKSFHHLHDVLRVKEGFMVHARLPDGSLQQMTVAAVDPAGKNMTLSVAGERSSVRAKEIPELWLFQFAARPPKMELILRQAVECGVSHFIPVAGAFCQGGSVESARKRARECALKEGRWQSIITEAMEQSGSAGAISVHECMTVREMCDLWKGARHPPVTGESAVAVHDARFALALYERSEGTCTVSEAAARLKEQMASYKDKGGAHVAGAVAVGAEGGIESAELRLLQSAGFIPVHFSTNILRCETAALYGVAAAQTVQEELLCQSKE